MQTIPSRARALSHPRMMRMESAHYRRHIIQCSRCESERVCVCVCNGQGRSALVCPWQICKQSATGHTLTYAHRRHADEADRFYWEHRGDARGPAWICLKRRVCMFDIGVKKARALPRHTWSHVCRRTTRQQRSKTIFKTVRMTYMRQRQRRRWWRGVDGWTGGTRWQDWPTTKNVDG